MALNIENVWPGKAVPVKTSEFSILSIQKHYLLERTPKSVLRKFGFGRTEVKSC